MAKIQPKKSEVKGGYLIKYHRSGVIWSKGKVKDGKPVWYWEWYRDDGKLKRSGWQAILDNFKKYAEGKK